ncbi:MAG TPA: HAD family hydrolase [Phycisphaerae bacterium]|nr:HAD family hydrolase [Phycisphaerae bacterium]
MAERAVFLDRDDTLIDNDGYLGDPSKVKLLTGAATALSAIRALGYRLIVVSNQSGVARGMFDETAVEAVNQEMCRQLREQAGAHIDASYYCPYHPEAPIAEYRVDHEWRKPKPGMLLQAAADFGLDLAQSWMIGDQPRDVAAGAAAGCRTILLRDPEKHAKAVATGEADPPALQVSPNFIVRTLADAARIIAREGRNPPTSGSSAPLAGPVSNPPVAEAAAPVSNAATPAEATAAAAQAAPAALPAAELTPSLEAAVEKIAERLSRQMMSQAVQAPANTDKLTRTLDDLVAQLRQQNRHADLEPEFSLARLAALIVQIIALVVFVIGLYMLVTAGVTLKDWTAVAQILVNLERTMGFLLAAVFLQVAALALLMVSRQR